MLILFGAKGTIRISNSEKLMPDIPTSHHPLKKVMIGSVPLHSSLVLVDFAVVAGFVSLRQGFMYSWWPQTTV